MEKNAYEVDVSIGSWTLRNGRGLLICRGLGSCLAVIMYNDIKGAMAHSMLPTRPRSFVGSFDARYVDKAVDLLTKAIGKNSKTKLVGGASMFGTDDIGQRNIEMARKELKKKGIRIVAEDVGGSRARSCFFDVVTKEVRVGTSVREGLTIKRIEKVL